jgi:hypothetical protein
MRARPIEASAIHGDGNCKRLCSTVIASDLQLALLPYYMLKLATTPPSISCGAACRAVDSLYTANLTQDVSSHLNKERTSYGFQNAGASEGN